ncbi:MAG: DUF4157 domain-containing protein, partial [bacterium]
LESELAQLQVEYYIKDWIRDYITTHPYDTVTIPEDEFKYNDWYGVGWITLDYWKACGEYIIAGYLEGGMTTKREKNWVEIFMEKLLEHFSEGVIIEDLEPKLLQELEEFYEQEFDEVVFMRGGPITDALMLGHPAVTIGETIVLAEEAELGPELAAHECAHVVQYRRDKTHFFFFYLYEWIKNGYEDSAFELEAIKKAELFMQIYYPDEEK